MPPTYPIKITLGIEALNFGAANEKAQTLAEFISDDDEISITVGRSACFGRGEVVEACVNCGDQRDCGISEERNDTIRNL